MGTLFFSEIKRQTSSFLQEKYKNARLVLTDVTEAELLTEEATNTDPWGPDARTMARISEAAFDVDDYWRIVDVLHRRLYTVNWKQWRQSYKALVLLEFLVTHGPENIGKEFHCDKDVIRELGNFKHIDERGFNWGVAMQKKSERILKLLAGGEVLIEARSKALKLSKEIQGFGNLLISPSSSSSKTSRTSSFASYSSSSSTMHDSDELNKQEEEQPVKQPNEKSQDESPDKFFSFPAIDKNLTRTHLWDNPIQESGSLLDVTEDDDPCEGTCTKFVGGGAKVPFRSFSNVSRATTTKKMDRQLSLGL